MNSGEIKKLQIDYNEAKEKHINVRLRKRIANDRMPIFPMRIKMWYNISNQILGYVTRLKDDAIISLHILFVIYNLFFILKKLSVICFITNIFKFKIFFFSSIKLVAHLISAINWIHFIQGKKVTPFKYSHLFSRSHFSHMGENMAFFGSPH